MARRITRVCGLALLTFAASWAFNADAHPMVCAKWQDLRAGWEKFHKEVPIGGGIVDAQTILTVTASADGAGFSVFLVRSDGVGCVLAVGKGWDADKPVVGTPG